MQELISYINENCVNNKEEIKSTLLKMICQSYEPIALDEKNLLDGLKLDGEFLLLKLHYSDFDTELKNEIIKYKISQALSVIVSYEDDGKSFENIEKFVNYIANIADAKQNATFGVKRVEELSDYPITILFSGILPINQLGMQVGQDIYDLIHSDDSYFPQRFSEFRDAISKEVDIPILPLFPRFNKEIKPKQVILTDLLDGRVISSFELVEDPSKDAVESYLLKLFYIYKTLVQQNKCRFSH